MGSFFNSENKAMRFLNNIANLILLNIVFLITCIPIVTIGASLSALYRVILMMYEGDEILVFKDYFHAFGKAFKRATLLWLVILILLAFFSYELYLLYWVLDQSIVMLQIPVWIMIFGLLMLIIYAFPMLSYFDLSMKTIIKNSLIIGLACFPTTILILVFQALLVLVATLNQIALVVVGSLCLFFGLALDAYVCGYFIKRIFFKEDEKTKEFFKEEKDRKKAQKMRKKNEKIREKAIKASEKSKEADY